jgi:predicted SprT family Zn-dependent metalloprotease
MKALTTEMYFEENRETTFEELERLANRLLETTWTIDLYRYKDASIINLKDLGWKFEYNTRKRAAGLCSYRYKTIYLSKYLVRQNLNKALEFENTLRHEVAHALDNAMGGRNKHNRIWKAIAREVLCTAERCYSSDVIKTTETTKYTLICENGCGKRQPSHRKIRGERSCGDCSGGKFNRQFIITQVQNY